MKKKPKPKTFLEVLAECHDPEINVEKDLSEFFMRSPFPEYDLDLKRSKDPGREFDL